MEKFIFKPYPGYKGTEVALISLLKENLNKDDQDLLDAFKKKLSSDNLTCHGKMMNRFENLIVIQFSFFNKTNCDYKNHTLYVFSLNARSNEWNLNRYTL